MELLPISDTVSALRAREAPEEVLGHYRRLAQRLWMPPQLEGFTKDVLSSAGSGRTTWASLSGPYGFGKTAAGILVWQHAEEEGFLAIPPLSCTNYDEFASGVAALAESQAPKEKSRVRKLFEEIWSEGLDKVVRTEAKRYDLPVRKLRQVLEDEFETGRWTPDGHSHRLVEFLARLAELASRWSRGLIVVVDELQQLLGPLDVSSLSRLREFVWGMRTEQSPCAVVLSLDSQLEARLGHWAADLLHRVREHSPALQMTGVFSREFPSWLWGRLTEGGKRGSPCLPAEALEPAVLVSLGQFVERPDLANGPRTVIDVFSRATEYYKETKAGYGIPQLVEDIHGGRFRFFGEGAPVQRILTQLFADDWIREDRTRHAMLRTLAAFPRGCPSEVLEMHVGNGKRVKTARDELFGPLLVQLSEGLALEQLQQVARGGSPWEQVLARYWDTLPGLSALVECAPELVSRVLLPRLFPGLDQPAGEWAFVTGDARTAVSGLYLLRGSFDSHFPLREVAVWVGETEPSSWPEDVDLCVAFLCNGDAGEAAKPVTSLSNRDGTPRISLTMPLLAPFDNNVPQELARYQKYIQPEPFRPAFVLAALRELEAYASQERGAKKKLIGSRASSNGSPESNGAVVDSSKVAALKRMEAFQEVCLDYLLHVLLQGDVDVGVGRPVRQRGAELLRALFTIGCRSRFPEYETLVTAKHWQGLLGIYRAALRKKELSAKQRRGQEVVNMPKGDAYRILFGQNSTAAGDSLVRSLGRLVQVSADTDSWSIRFAQHPAETALLDFLRSVARKRPAPREAALEFLRHKGYIETEAGEIVEILLARELLTADDRGRVRSVADQTGVLETLKARIAELHRELSRLGEYTAPTGEPTSGAALQERCNDLEAKLRSRLADSLAERTRQGEVLTELIGCVRGIRIAASWPKTGMTSHLSGIAQTLCRSQTSLLQGLRRELGAVEEDLGEARPVSFEWTLRWMKRKESACRSVEKLKERVTEFERQSTALLGWVPVIQQLFATDSLCTKIGATNLAPRQLLDELLSGYREQFATNGWEPLYKVGEFKKKLELIEREVQGLVFSQARAFYEELETLRCRFGRLLPDSAPPSFDLPRKGSNREAPGFASFHALYRWALTGLRGAYAKARRLHSKGVPWGDPKKRRRTWSELSGAVETGLGRKSEEVSFSEILSIGGKITELLAGFRHEEPMKRVYDDPNEAPDFEAIKEMFLRGHVVIHVEPKRIAGLF